MKKIVIFDLDGTLLLRKNKNWETDQLVLWLEYNGVKNPKQIIKNKKWSNRKERITLLNIDMEKYKKWYENFQIIEYQNNINLLNKNKIFLAKESINLLKTISNPKVLVSNSCKEWVNYAIDFFNIRNYFDFIFERDYKFGKPIKPDIKIKTLLEKHFSKLSKKSLVIGDSSKDMEFAKNIGLRFVSVYNKKIESNYFFKNIETLRDNLPRIL